MSSWIRLLLLRTLSFALSAWVGSEAFRGGRTAIDGFVVGFVFCTTWSCDINGVVIVGVEVGFGDTSISADCLTPSGEPEDFLVVIISQTGSF